MNKIRKGDEVIVLAGRDKGKRGTVVQRVDDEHVVVEGINLVKKHDQAEPDEGHDRRHRRQDDADPPCRTSRLFNAATGKADRVGIKVDGRQESPRLQVQRRSSQGVSRSWPVCKNSIKKRSSPT